MMYHRSGCEWPGGGEVKPGFILEVIFWEQ